MGLPSFVANIAIVACIVGLATSQSATYAWGIVWIGAPLAVIQLLTFWHFHQRRVRKVLRHEVLAQFVGRELPHGLKVMPCPNCEYNLIARPSGTICPECGFSVREAE